MRALHRAVLVLAAVALTALAFTAPSPAAQSPRTAPALHLPGRAGAVDSDSLHARVVLVDFWASWCVPCRRSFPWLAQMQERYGSKGLAIVAVNLDRERPAADAFLARFPAPFQVAFDPEGKTAESYGVKGMPTTYLVGRDGTVLLSHAGFDDKSAAELEQRIAQELAP